MPFEHVARQDLRIARANGVDEVLIMRVLRRRQPRGLGVRIGCVSAWALLVLRAEVRLPLLPVFLDPQPALRAVEQVADLHAAFVVREAAARAELEERAVGVLEEAVLQIRRFLRRLVAEVAAGRSDLERVLLLAQAPARDVELVRTLVAAVAVAVVPVPVPVVVEAVAVERPLRRWTEPQVVVDFR